MVIGGQNYTGLQAVNLKSSGGIRFGGFDANAGTLYINPASLESTRQWNLPDKSGVFGISGTFLVNLPAVAATTLTYSTIVTVSGIRAEDGLIISMMKGTTAGYDTYSSAKIFYSASPGNGNITMQFTNLGVATGYTENVVGYTAVR